MGNAWFCMNEKHGHQESGRSFEIRCWRRIGESKADRHGKKKLRGSKKRAKRSILTRVFKRMPNWI